MYRLFPIVLIFLATVISAIFGAKMEKDNIRNACLDKKTFIYHGEVYHCEIKTLTSPMVEDEKTGH